jgi:signal transduction histidine kinase
MPSYLLTPDVMNLWLPLAVIVFIEGLAIHTWQYRREAGALWQCWLQASKGFWLLALLIGNRSMSLQQATISHEAGTALSLMACFLWFRFVVQLSGDERRMPRSVLPALDGVLALGCVLSLTNTWHGWLWHSVRVAGGSFEAQTAPAGFAILLAVCVLSAVTITINIRWAMRNVGLRRRQAWMFLLPSLVSWTGYCVSCVFDLDQARFAVRAISFFLTSLIMIWAFHRWRLYSILPLAKDVVLGGMVDGLMVIDDEGYIVELNAPARAIFASSAVSLGKTIKDAHQAWPQMVCRDDSVSIWESERKQDDVVSYHQITRIALRTPAGHVLGQVLVFKDITREKLQHARLVEQEKTLSTLEERSRLSRELHDGPGQLCGYLSMQTQSARILIAKQKYEQADQRLEQLQQAVQDVHLSLRESITGLQSETHEGRSLLESLQEQLLWYQENCNLRVELNLRCVWPAEMLARRTEAQLLHILQEALANVRKSAQASLVRIVIEKQDGHLVFLVEDDGCGFDPAVSGQLVGHHGLEIMHERAEEIGAQLIIDSFPGSGTKVELRVPLVAEKFSSPAELS